MLRWFGLRRVLVVVAGVAMIAPWCGMRPVAAATGSRAAVSASMPASGGPLTGADEASSAALAASTGQPVESLADRTDWQQVFAEPGGGFLAQESAVPVRVLMPNGSWVPVDTMLSARADGSVAPGAVVPGVALSGGGSGSLFTVSQATGDPAGSVSVSWP